MLLTFNTQVKKLLDQHRKCLSFRMQFEDVTLPPTLSFLLIYICFLYIFILILTEFFLFFLQIFSYLTNLLFFKSNCYITFHTPNSIKYIMLCSSHRSPMDWTAEHQHSSLYAGSQFSLRTRTYTCTQIFVYVSKHTAARGQIIVRKKGKRKILKKQCSQLLYRK